MKSKYESKETFLATLQIEDDFKNLIIYLEELELLFAFKINNSTSINITLQK